MLSELNLQKFFSFPSRNANICSSEGDVPWAAFDKGETNK